MVAVTLLKIDQSGGAYDISYHAWNYLLTEKSAAEDPASGEGLAAVYEDAPVSDCADAIKESKGRFAFSAANSVNFVTNCPSGSWVARNYALYNIVDSACTQGYDEECTSPLPRRGNQLMCPHQLRTPALLTTLPVYNLDYMTGKNSVAQ